MTPYRKNITYRQYFWGVRPSRLRGLSSPNCHRTSKGKFNFRSWKRSACARPPSKLQVAVAKTTRSCETSWKHCAGVKSWKRSSRASHPSGTASWYAWNRSFRARLPSKTCKLKVWNRSFRARLPSKTAIRSRENEAFVRDILRKLQVAIAHNEGLGDRRQPVQRLVCATCVALYATIISCAPIQRQSFEQL